MNAEGIIARSDLKEQIEAAANEGNYSSLAALYAELVSRNPANEDLRILEIETLERNYAFVEAEAKANAATKLFPRSLTMAQRFADCAFQLQNWQVAANQFQSLRSRFDPREHFGAAASILDEFKCYACMADETAACALVEAHWHTIKSYDARQYGGRIEVFEIGEFIRAEDFPEFTNWSSQAVPHEGREGYMRRTRLDRQEQALGRKPRSIRRPSFAWTELSPVDPPKPMGIAATRRHNEPVRAFRLSRDAQ